MFEWADGGTLRDLWQKRDASSADLNAHRIMKVLEQLHGLAEALSKLHNKGSHNRTPENIPKPFARTETLVPSSSEDVPKIRIEADYGSNANTNKTGEEHWRHGDLKPDNILLFKDASSWLGTLKIADLGLAKQHEFATAKRVDATGQRYSTSQYEAPEVVIKRDAPRSRLYDIWSMGCIIFEFVIWLLYGSSGLQNFYTERPQTDRGISTLYFTALTEDSAQISDVAKKWIDHILRSDPECNGKSPSALGDLVRLVKDHLLVVALPGASVRTRGDAELFGKQPKACH
ncbi:hypothetical protein CEP52_009961 [Fusarium oligoseptatum]|uniref:Protein kinase domain-containing protein n=1 Tax=Fusarium oligoseptatum TaxID=2604345 RepID=A0A428TAF5_9HYPO|nr:hypothetical protein CEP52_009961 [Fusarium oligoseptatum]